MCVSQALAASFPDHTDMGGIGYQGAMSQSVSCAPGLAGSNDDATMQSHTIPLLVNYQRISTLIAELISLLDKYFLSTDN